jgi:alanyl-tRNA synthetase
LTLELAEERGLTVDTARFDELMKQQRERARAARAALGDLAWEGIDFGGDTTPTEFVGYDALETTATITAIVFDNELTATVSEGCAAILVLDRTPFYAEMGGQAADHGVIRSGDAGFTVTDVQRTKGGKYVHHGVVARGAFSLGDAAAACVTPSRRNAIRRAHSATHLLQAALRKILGDHVLQSGSLVEPDRLRFDFTHFQAMTPEELLRVENDVNNAILDGAPIQTREMPVAEAKKLGATALFGEKYGDTVRVVTMEGRSIELCGGTHLNNTAMAGAFRIKSEFSVASGVRRIEATTGFETLVASERERAQLAALTSELKANSPDELSARLEQLNTELRALRRAAAQASAKASLSVADEILAAAQIINGLTVVAAAVENADADRLRKLGDALRDKSESIAAVLASVTDGKLTFLAVCGSAAVKAGVRAGDLIKSVTAVAGGSGGGKPDSAMGGGKDVSKLSGALDAVYEFVKGVK